MFKLRAHVFKLRAKGRSLSDTSRPAPVTPCSNDSHSGDEIAVEFAVRPQSLGYGQAMRLLGLFLLGRLGLLGVVLAVYDVWRRLSMKRRRWLVSRGCGHGSRIATRAWAFVAGTIGR
ncbi:MAG: hypothetical protein ACXVYM_06695 [Gaiellaceae bacterium]